jgi:hypothetical protein
MRKSFAAIASDSFGMTMERERRESNLTWPVPVRKRKPVDLMGATGFGGAAIEVDDVEEATTGGVEAAVGIAAEVESGSATADSLIDKSLISSTGASTDVAAATIIGVSAGLVSEEVVGEAAGSGFAAVGAAIGADALFLGSKLMVGKSAVSPAQNFTASNADTPALVSGYSSA